MAAPSVVPAKLCAAPPRFGEIGNPVRRTDAPTARSQYPVCGNTCRKPWPKSPLIVHSAPRILTSKHLGSLACAASASHPIGSASTHPTRTPIACLQAPCSKSTVSVNRTGSPTLNGKTPHNPAVLDSVYISQRRRDVRRLAADRVSSSLESGTSIAVHHSSCCLVACAKCTARNTNTKVFGAWKG